MISVLNALNHALNNTVNNVEISKRLCVKILVLDRPSINKIVLNTLVSTGSRSIMHTQKNKTM